MVLKAMLGQWDHKGILVTKDYAEGLLRKDREVRVDILGLKERMVLKESLEYKDW